MSGENIFTAGRPDGGGSSPGTFTTARGARGGSRGPRFGPRFAKAGDLPFSASEPLTAEGPAEQGRPGWARRVSNLRPLAGEARFGGRGATARAGQFVLISGRISVMAARSGPGRDSSHFADES